MSGKFWLFYFRLHPGIQHFTPSYWEQYIKNEPPCNLVISNLSTSRREFQRRKDKTKNKGPRNQEKKTQKQHEQRCQSHTCSKSKKIKKPRQNKDNMRPHIGPASYFACQLKLYMHTNQDILVQGTQEKLSNCPYLEPTLTRLAFTGRVWWLRKARVHSRALH